MAPLQWINCGADTAQAYYLTNDGEVWCLTCSGQLRTPPTDLDAERWHRGNPRVEHVPPPAVP